MASSSRQEVSSLALACECCSQDVDIAHDFLALSDVAVAKALMISEMAQIARTEVRMRGYLIAKWNVRAEQAARHAGILVAAGGTLDGALKSVDAVMHRWAQEVAPTVGAEIERIYQLAREAGWKKANGQTKQALQYVVPNLSEVDSSVAKAKKKPKLKTPELKPSFDLHDEQAVIQLQDDQLIWIGGHYAKNVRDVLREAVKPSVIEGLGRAEAGKRVREAVESKLKGVSAPSGFRGSQAKYFEGLAANIATNARVRGQIRSFADLGVTHYVIVNPMDERTTEICRYMNGKVFPVSAAVAQIEKVSGATDPDEVKDAQPWVSAARAKEIGADGTDALAAAGLALPPYHFRCRSTCDISFEAGSHEFENLEDVPDRPEPTRHNTPKDYEPTAYPKPRKPGDRPETIPRKR